MKRSKTPLRQEKQSFTHFMNGSEKWLNRICYFLAALIIALIVGGISLHANANPTDWHDNELSEQIQQEARCELKGAYMKTAYVYRLILRWQQKKNCRLTPHKNKQKLTALGVNNETFR